MKILAIDTSLNACSVALLMHGEIQSLHKVAPMQQAQLILPLIDELMQSAGVTLPELNALAFGCGPGSFTGVRIAASVAQGLAFASHLPLISISSMGALAQAAYYDLGWKKLLVGIDARMHEVYWAAYAVNGEGLVELVGEEIVCAPQQVGIPETTDWYGVGNAWQVYHNALLARLNFVPIAQDDTRLPMASAILMLAQEKLRKNDWLKPHEALPVYLRNNVAVKKSGLF